MTVTIPRWLLVLLGALVGAAIAVGVTLYVTEDDDSSGTGPAVASETPTEPKTPTEPSTSPEELADIEASAKEWEAVFAEVTDRCAHRAEGDPETYDECAARDVWPPTDAASAQLAQEWATLEPVVAPKCAEALDQVARQLLDRDFAFAEDALPPCRNSVSP